MAEKKMSPNTLLRASLYLALALMIWLKLWAGPAIQRVAVLVLFTLVLLVVDCHCVVLVVGSIRFGEAKETKLIARWTSIYILVAGLIGLLLCNSLLTVCIISAVEGVPVPPGVFGSAWISGVAGLVLTWAGAYELRIRNDSLVYFSLGTGHRSLDLRDIDHARVRVGWFTYMDRFQPTSRLEILPVKSKNMHMIVINLKVFSRADVELLFDWLGTKLADEDSERQ